MNKQILILALTLGSVLSLMSQPMRDDRGGRGREEVAEMLNLTDVQKERIEQLRVSFHKASQPLENQLDEKRAALKSLTTVDGPDKKKIDATVGEIGKLETSLLQARVNHMLEVRALLDDSQKVTFDQHADRRMKSKFDKRPYGRPY